MNKEVFISNRRRLIDKIEDNSIVILFGGEAKYKTADEKYPFTPNRNFYYLTGIDEEKHVLVISKYNSIITEQIYIKRPDPVMEKWVGRTIRGNEAREVSGIKDIQYLDSLLVSLNQRFISGDYNNLYLDLERREFEEGLRYPHIFAKDIREKYPQIITKNIYNEISELRQIKSQEEIEEMKIAIRITTEGVESLMRNAKPDITEGALEAYFDFHLKQQEVKDLAFNTIAAAGKNATILHYNDNNTKIKKNDLILFDLGAQFNYYNADISRTFPVSGKFTKRQKEVYEAVLRVNEAVISMIKPGVSFIDLNEKANELIGEECVNLCLIEDKKDFRKYYWHSIGHSLGLDTHDVGKRAFIFKEGMVFTVEPGIYIEEEGIGVRIEDDVLVTKEGVEVLTKNCIKSVKDIEEFMANR